MLSMVDLVTCVHEQAMAATEESDKRITEMCSRITEMENRIIQIDNRMAATENSRIAQIESCIVQMSNRISEYEFLMDQYVMTTKEVINVKKQLHALHGLVWKQKQKDQDDKIETWQAIERLQAKQKKEMKDDDSAARMHKIHSMITSFDSKLEVLRELVNKIMANKSKKMSDLRQWQ